MFHNSTAIRSSLLRGSGKGGWPGEELSTIDKDQTLVQLTQNEGGWEEKSQISEVNMIPSPTLNPIQGIIGGYSTGLQSISGPWTRPIWPGEDLSTINNGNNGTRENNGGGADVFHPAHQSSIQEKEGGQQEEENLTFSLEELGLTPEEFETLSHPNISETDVNPPPSLELEGSRRPQGKEMLVEGVLKLPSKEICMGSRIRDIKLRVNYGAAAPVFLRMDLHRLMHLLNLISIPQPQPQSPSQEPEPSHVISASDSSPTTPSSFISGESDSQQVPEIYQGPLIEDTMDRPGPSKNRNKKTSASKPTPKVKMPKGRGGVPHNSAAKARGKAGWRYSCYFCTKRCRALSHLNEHISIHTMEKPFPCDKCTKRFIRNSNLTKHKRVHALDPAIRRPFKCQECGQSFAQNQNLTTHIKIIHRGVKEYKCLKCNKKFGTESEMMKHHDAKHLKIRHPCSKLSCGKTSSFKGDVQRHMKQVHPKILQPIQE